MLFALALAFPGPAAANPPESGWPQWGGVHRNFHVDSTGLADTWPPSGPRRLWKRRLGEGYSGVAVVNGKLFTMYRRDGREVVAALDAGTGKTLWEHSYPAPFLPGTDLEHGPGPHTTPLVVAGHVCTTGVTGILHCLRADTGKVEWKHHLLEEFDGTVLFRGYSASPIAYEDTVIVPVGGAGHAAMAFRLQDGTVAWQAQDFQISHASPILVAAGGRDHLVVLASKVIAGLDPADGKLIWRLPHPLGGGHVASTPIWGDDDRLFFSAAYTGGSACVQVRREGDTITARQEWYTTRMRVHHSNAIRVGDHVYGSSGDFGPKIFTALDVSTGKIVWRDRALSRSSCVYAHGKLIVLEEDGHLALATVSPTGLEVRSKVELFEGRAWTPPSLVGSTLYVRNRKDIMALDLAVASGWTEVLADSFRLWRSTTHVAVSGEPYDVPVGWTIIPRPASAERTWKWARLDGARDPRFAERSYAVTNGTGLPDCWFTRVLSYLSGPGFEVEVLAMNYGKSPALLTIRVVDDHGAGHEGMFSLGVEDSPNQIRHVNPTDTSAPSRVLVASDVDLPGLERGVARRLRLSWRDGHLVLRCDDQVLAKVRADARQYSAVQFLAPRGRLILDDFRMRADVVKPESVSR